MIVRFANQIISNGGSESPSAFEINGESLIQEIQAIRAQERLLLPRGNFATTITFENHILNSSIALAVAKAGALPSRLAIRTGTFEWEYRGPGNVAFHLRNAALSMRTRQRGSLVIASYIVRGGLVRTGRGPST